ncbi:hypothetical protein BDR04DRAFT_997260, partial [Suillus decipiens]
VSTWLGLVPSNFGEVSAGMLKADEWRSLIMVHLPIALVSLWGAGTSHSSYELSANIMSGELENTMLCSFIKAASFCHWLTQPDCPPVIQECRILFDRVYSLKGATGPSQEFAEDPMDDVVQAPDLATTSTVPEDLYIIIR